MQETTKDLILRLKRIKEQERLSNANIMQMIDDNGDQISSTTLTRVFAKGSEEQNFRYYETLQPIAKALLRLDQSEEGISDEEQATKDVALIKDMEYRLILEKCTKYEERIKYLEERVEYLKKQVEVHQKAIERKDSQIAERDKIIDRITQSMLEVVKDYVTEKEREKEE